jgi:hypothetical protein
MYGIRKKDGFEKMLNKFCSVCTGNCYSDSGIIYIQNNKFKPRTNGHHCLMLIIQAWRLGQRLSDGNQMSAQ